MTPALVEKLGPLYRAAHRKLDFELEAPPKPARVCDIQRAVCKALDVSLPAMLSQRKPHREKRARFLAIWLATELTFHSNPTLGRLFGDRDHTTILNSVKRFHAMAAVDPELAALAATLLARLRGNL